MRATSLIMAILIGTTMVGQPNMVRAEGTRAIKHIEELKQSMIDKIEEQTKQYKMEEEANKTKTVTISFAGDFTLGKDATTQVYNTFDRKYGEVGKDPKYFLKNVKPIFEADDITIVNLETTLTNETKYANKQFKFKGRPEYRHILTEGSVDTVSLANNHTMDYFQKGYDDTKANLCLSEIGYVDNNTSIIKEANGIKVGIMGFKGWDAGQGTKNNIKKHIDKLKAEGADILVAMFHWGNEREHYPIATQTNLAHYLIDNGVDVVTGGHAHVLQSTEIYKNKPIVYGLGNFCYGGHSNPKDKDTMIYQQTFTFIDGVKQDEINAKVIPCSISSDNSTNNFQPTPYEDGTEGYNRIIKRLNEYSNKRNAKIQTDGKLTTK